MEQAHHHNHHAHMIRDFKQRFWVSVIITLPIIVLAPIVQGLLGYELHFQGDRQLQFSLATIVFLYGGWPFLKGLVDEIAKRAPGMMTLIAVAISVAYCYSSAVVFGLGGKIFFWELVSLIDIMLLGHWIEMKSIMGASNALQELVNMMPATAQRIKPDGESEDVPIAALKRNDIILVRPGGKIPADGIVVEGESRVNEAMLTGEARPVAKHKDDNVIGGAINGSGVLKIKVKGTGYDSYLSKVIRMVEAAQQTKSKTQNLANKAAAYLFYIALGAGITTLVVWLNLGKDVEYALERTVTVMVISCPHALGLAIPLVTAISTSAAAQKGLLIRNRAAFENSRKLTRIIFDKTGTLTKGEFGVTRFISTAKELGDKQLLRLGFSVEYNAEHPIASGIVRKAKELGLKRYASKNFQQIAGKGAEALVGGRKIAVVSPGFLKEKGIEVPADALKNEIETVVFVLSDTKLLGFIALADQIRKDSFEAVKILKKRGVKVVMATGDNENTAKAVSQTLGLDNYYSEVLPEEKQQIVKDAQGKGEFVAMTGDGVNDAPALAQADVGIAVGSGTDVAAETADIVLVNSNPKDIAMLTLLSAATYNKMMQNLWWAAGYNIVTVPLAAGVLAGVGVILSPAVGAVLMSLSTVIVALNAQLLKKQIINQNEKFQ